MSVVVVSPAPMSAALNLAPMAARYRKAVLWQVRNYQSIGFEAAGQWIAVAMMRPRPCGRLELALLICRKAMPHMRALVRQAQLTLALLAQNYVVFAIIDTANRAGQRMAAMIGMTPVRGTGKRWMRAG
jgi:hypothetical protein